MKTFILFFTFVSGFAITHYYTSSSPVPQEPIERTPAKITYTLPDASKYTSMRRDPIASSGKCTVKGVSTIKQAMAMIDFYDINLTGATDNEKLVLGAALYQTSVINGGRFEPFTDITIDVESRTGASRYLKDKRMIQLNRCKSDKTKCGDIYNINVARLIHELGHKFGRTDSPEGVQYYDIMVSQVKSCYPTPYADNNINERTAEIISAFLTRPQILNGTKTCQPVFDFLATKVFKGNGKLTTCDSEKLAALEKRFRNVRDSETKETLKDLFAEKETN